MRVLTFIIFILSSICSIAEPERPFEREAMRHEAMLFSGKYSQLEKLAREYLVKNATISDGQPAYAALHGGVSGCLSNGCNDYLSEEQWKEKLDHLQKWSKEYPESTTAKVALASYYMEFAWHARGQGYANTVTDNGWKLFNKYTEQASIELKSISQEGKADPRWYDSMLMIGLAKKWSKKRLDAIYEEGITRFPLYLPLYFNKSTYLAPRWYGSNQELRSYIEESVARTRKDLGETLYARLNWSLWTMDMFTNGQANWGRMRKGFERIVKDYPDEWNVNNFAKFACIAQDWNTLHELGKDIKTPVLAAWAGSKKNFDRCLAFAARNTRKS